MKMYCKEYKYGGEQTESFSYKFGLFIDLSSKANLPNEALPFVFSSMLKEIALEYYHTNFYGFNLTIMEHVQKFKTILKDKNTARLCYKNGIRFT